MYPVMMKKISGDSVGKGMSFFMLGGEIARTTAPLIIVGTVSLWGLQGTYRLIPFGILASIILFFKIGFLRKSGKFAKLMIIFPAKFSPTIDLNESLLNIKSWKIL